MKSILLLAVLIQDDFNDFTKLQYELTKFGSIIRTRLGISDLECDDANKKGLVILELYAEEKQAAKLEETLLAFNGIRVKRITF